MKLTLIALLVVFAAVVVLKAEEINDEEDSVATLDDAILEDEITEVENDPKRSKMRHRHMMRRGFCGRMFKFCIVKNRARCDAVKGCRHKYVKCRFIKMVKMMKIRRCIRKALGGRRRKHDEPENDDEEGDLEQAVHEADQDEAEDPKGKKRMGLCRRLHGRCKKGKGRCLKLLKKCLRVLRKIRAHIIKKIGKKRLLKLLACKGGYKKCSRGQKYCGRCLMKARRCVKKAMRRRCGRRSHDEPSNDDHEAALADIVEDEEEEEVEADEEDVQDEVKDELEDESEDPAGKKGKKKRCLKRLVKCKAKHGKGEKCKKLAKRCKKL